MTEYFSLEPLGFAIDKLEMNKRCVRKGIEGDWIVTESVVDAALREHIKAQQALEIAADDSEIDN